MPIAIKLGRLVTYLDKLLLVSHGILQSPGTMRSCDKSYTLYLHLKQTNDKVVTYHEGLPPTKSHEPLNSSDITSLNHHSHNVCGYQTSQDDNILPEAPIYKAEWLFNEVIFRGHNILYILLQETNMHQASHVA